MASAFRRHGPRAMPDQAHSLRLLSPRGPSRDTVASHDAAVVRVRRTARVIACCSCVPSITARQAAIALGQALVVEGQRVGVPLLLLPNRSENAIERAPLPCPVFDLAKPEQRRSSARRADQHFDLLLVASLANEQASLEAICAPETLLVAGLDDVDVARAYAAIKALDRRGSVAALRLVLCGTGDSAGVARRLRTAALRFLGLEIGYLGSISPVWLQPGEDRTELRRTARALLELNRGMSGAEAFIEDCAQRLGLPSDAVV